LIIFRVAVGAGITAALNDEDDAGYLWTFAR
jgi:hypothetical protein